MYNPTININWKKVIIFTVIFLALIVVAFSIYQIFFVPTEQEIEDSEREILDERLQDEMDALQRAREEARGDDYVPPTAEEREADMERQIQELQDLRRR